MDEDVEYKRRRLGGRRIAAISALVIVAMLLIVWSQRVDIATGFIDRELEKRGVKASYTLRRIGFRTQQLENLVIGDPANPDLTARFVEVTLPLVSLLDPSVEKITARGVRLKGRMVNGKLRLGEIDKLLPPPSGAPFALPDLNVDVADVSMSLTGPAGRIGLAIEGRGNLSNGFKGKVAALSRQIDFGTCRVLAAATYFDVAIADRRPAVKGPLKAQDLTCGQALQVAGPALMFDANFPETINEWRGNAGITAAAVRSGINRLDGVEGRITFDGKAKETKGDLAIGSRTIQIAAFGGRQLDLDGKYALSLTEGRLSLIGEGGARNIAAASSLLGPVTAALSSANGTPIDPIGEGLAAALSRAGRDFDARARVRLVNGPGGGAVRFDTMNGMSRSGMTLALAGGDGITYYWPQGAIRTDGEFALSGGGFPTTRLSLDQPYAGAPVRGEARIQPMRAGSARLALGTIRFQEGADGSTRFQTMAAMTGPFDGGFVTNLVLPLVGRFDGAGGFAVNERCVTANFAGLRYGSLNLGRTRLPVCPVGRALVWKAPGGDVKGGLDIRSPRLIGRLGSSPLDLTAGRFRFEFDESDFAGTDVIVRLGPDGFANRLELERIAGQIGDSGVTGTFAGASGKIANVPLLISRGQGKWSVIGGRLSVAGGLTVADDHPEPRFYPLITNAFRLTLDGDRIDAFAPLRDPEAGVLITNATIQHNLASGSGNAVLDVPGIRFAVDGYQPEDMTRLTLGVVALVDGMFQGRGNIGWGDAGTTSDGVFSIVDTDLAASFGPVQGLNTTLTFTDLLGLVTAPSQLATVERVQAGIDVFDGRIRYQVLPDLRVKVEEGRWPFAGGQLILEETILNFAEESEKRLTFRIEGMDAAAFVQQMEFSNIAATGTLDGVLPMVFDQSGGRIVGGRLVARPGGGTLSYVGELTDKDLGAWGIIAFNALKSLSYSKLVIQLDGSLAGEFTSRIELDSISRTVNSKGGGIVDMVLAQFAKVPIDFNINIKGPFRSIIAMTRSFDDPSDLILPVLPENLEVVPTTTDVQREESETVQ
ncbi:intermembrane phospholipid transport protein YdbH family protein [Allosphingosinicella vermicomposti]|uniref:intermembrane phospholipid transport protein YdbH family protein n=1 Tax=Allosphingosinicella vermicomposti TaxID=614671 RepID=UPI00131A5648|nr:YdbH domain-containing protein [Allosphingosinicella vermicomposti]